jgi:hypothetical protein
VPFPQPVPAGDLRLRILSDGAYDALELRLYSVARVEVLALQSGAPARPGWSEARFGLPALPQGLYHFRLQARRGAARSRPLEGSLFLLGAP